MRFRPALRAFFFLAAVVFITSCSPDKQAEVPARSSDPESHPPIPMPPPTPSAAAPVPPAITPEPSSPPSPVPFPFSPPLPALPPAAPVSKEERLEEVKGRVLPLLVPDLAQRGLSLGNPVFIRIFKESGELEVWVKPKSSATFKPWRKWPIAAMSGTLGPKLKEGDRQAPEGFYSVGRQALNPRSTYHLSFNIGYPNAYDRAHQRTGSFIMVHGNAVSIGCYAMTDPVIEWIYLVVEAALMAGQREVPVHVFPFRMTEQRMLQARQEHPALLPFWTMLKAGYTAFETTSRPPEIRVEGGVYRIHPVGVVHDS